MQMLTSSQLINLSIVVICKVFQPFLASFSFCEVSYICVAVLAGSHERRLLNDLMNTYNKLERPVTNLVSDQNFTVNRNVEDLWCPKSYQLPQPTFYKVRHRTNNSKIDPQMR